MQDHPATLRPRRPTIVVRNAAVTPEEFFELAERFRNSTDPDEIQILGDTLGRAIFGGCCQTES